MNTTPMQSSTMRKKSGKLVMPTLIKSGENAPTNVEKGTIKMKLPMIRFTSTLFNKITFVIMIKTPKMNNIMLSETGVTSEMLTAAAVHRALPKFSATVKALPKQLNIKETIK